MPSRKKNTYNDNMIALATWEAFYDLLMGDPNGLSLEEKNIMKLNVLYGPKKEITITKEMLKR